LALRKGKGKEPLAEKRDRNCPTHFAQKKEGQQKSTTKQIVGKRRSFYCTKKMEKITIKYKKSMQKQKQPSEPLEKEVQPSRTKGGIT